MRTLSNFISTNIEEKLKKITKCPNEKSIEEWLLILLNNYEKTVAKTDITLALVEKPDRFEVYIFRDNPLIGEFGTFIGVKPIEIEWIKKEEGQNYPSPLFTLSKEYFNKPVFKFLE